MGINRTFSNLGLLLSATVHGAPLTERTWKERHSQPFRGKQYVTKLKLIRVKATSKNASVLTVAANSRYRPTG